MGQSLGIIADDFTGALMVAGFLESEGIYCPVVFDAAAIVPGAPVIIAGTRTRTVPVADALEQLRQMAEAMLGAGYARLAYKACATFDSTAEGNIGPAADFLADLAELRPVLMSAGFPKFGTTVHQGYLFYRGRLVSESIKRFDPLTPMSDPDLVRFLSSQTPHKIGLIDHAKLQKGLQIVEEAVGEFAKNGCGHIFFDASDDKDVEIAAEIAAQRPSVVCASDPMIIAYARKLAGGGVSARPPLPRHVSGPGVVLAGSVGEVVLRQLAEFGQSHPVFTLDLLDPRGEDAVVASVLEWAQSLIGERPFAISTATDSEGVARTQAVLGQIGAARLAEHLLGSIARGLRDRGVRRFVVAGGETSGAVVSALDIGSVRALPEGPLGTGFCVSQGDQPLSLFLKPGKLGADDILLRAMDSMS